MNKQIQDVNIVLLMSLRICPKYPAQLLDAINYNVIENKQIKQATLYSYLKRLEEHDMVYSFWGDESKGGRRKYYQLTDYGMRFCLNNLQDYESLYVEPDFTEPSDDKPKRIREIPSEESQQEIAKRLAQLASGEVNEVKYEAPIQSKPEITPEDLARRQIAASLLYKSPIIESKPPKKEEAEQIVEDIIQVTEDASTPSNAIFQTETAKANKSGNAIDPNETENEKRYKNILSDLVGEHLEQIPEKLRKPDYDPLIKHTTPIKKNNNKNATLIDMADMLTIKGIKVKLYNQLNVAFKGASFLYSNKARASSCWLSFLFAAVISAAAAIIYFLLNNTFTEPVIYALTICGIVSLSPAILSTIILIFNSSKRIKPKFKFGYSFINFSIGYLAIILFIAALNLLVFKTVFTDYNELFKYLVFPLTFFSIVVLYPICYNIVYKKMMAG